MGSIPSNKSPNFIQRQISSIYVIYNGNEWLPVGDSIVTSSPNDDQKFGYNIEMSVDGNLLLFGLNHPDCRYNHQNSFVPDKCTKSPGALFELYTYDPENNRFMQTPLREGVEDAKEVSDGSILHGLHFSLSNGDDDGSTLLSVSNYNLDDEVVFVDVIDLDQLYYTKCAVEYPDNIGNGYCTDFPPYNTAECGFDGGDCDLYNGLTDCHVDNPTNIGNGDCDDYSPYNTAEYGFDGGDCLIDEYPDCVGVHPSFIGDGYCHGGPYNTEECGFDGGDCVPKPVDGYPDCLVKYPGDIGDGICNQYPPYNTAECGFDGGDCNN